MTEPLLILDAQGFHVRIHDTWHHGLTREESRRLLLAAGIDQHDTDLLLDSPVWWPEPREIEYRPSGRRRWFVDGRPVTKEGAAWVFRRVGMSLDAARQLMRIHQLSCEIKRRLRPPSADCITVEECLRLLAEGLAQSLALRVARRWVREHLRPARRKHRRKLDSWKEHFERDHPKRRITNEGFTQALADSGIRVVGDHVYCEELQA